MPPVTILKTKNQSKINMFYVGDIIHINIDGKVHQCEVVQFGLFECKVTDKPLFTMPFSVKLRDTQTPLLYHYIYCVDIAEYTIIQNNQPKKAKIC